MRGEAVLTARGRKGDMCPAWPVGVDAAEEYPRTTPGGLNRLPPLVPPAATPCCCAERRAEYCGSRRERDGDGGTSWEASRSDVLRRCCDPSSRVTAAAAVGDFPPRRSDEEIDDPIIIDACVDGEAGMTPGVPPDAEGAIPALPPPVGRAGEGAAAAAAAAEPSVSIVRCGRFALLRLGVAILAESSMFPSKVELVEICGMSCPELDIMSMLFTEYLFVAGGPCRCRRRSWKEKPRVSCA
mmetsp:Transcript_32231/g.94900  ORF Transcript_32231/g.94900 Transcript_32231/m.94900 type:complete len:241 (+) Transcript_32231:1910-2632(+)